MIRLKITSACKNIVTAAILMCLAAIYGCAAPNPQELEPKEIESIKSGRCEISSELGTLDFKPDIHGSIFVSGSTGSDYRNQELFELKRCKRLMKGRAVFKFLDSLKQKDLGSCNEVDGRSINGCRFLHSIGDVPSIIQAKLDNGKWTIIFSESSSIDKEAQTYVDKFKAFWKLDGLGSKRVTITDEDLAAVSNLKLMEVTDFKALVERSPFSYGLDRELFLFLSTNMDPFLQSLAAFERNKFPFDIKGAARVINDFSDKTFAGGKLRRLIEYSRKENRVSFSDQLINDEMRRVFEDDISNLSELETYYSKLLELGLVERLNKQAIKISPIKGTEYGLRISWAKKSLDIKSRSQCREVRTSAQSIDTGFIESVFTASSNKTNSYKVSKCTGEKNIFNGIEYRLVGNMNASNQLDSSWEISELISTDYSKDLSSSSTSGSKPSSSSGSIKAAGVASIRNETYDNAGRKTEGYWVKCSSGRETRVYRSAWDKSPDWFSPNGLGTTNFLAKSSASINAVAQSVCK